MKRTINGTPQRKVLSVVCIVGLASIDRRIEYLGAYATAEYGLDNILAWFIPGRLFAATLIVNRRGCTEGGKATILSQFHRDISRYEGFPFNSCHTMSFIAECRCSLHLPAHTPLTQFLRASPVRYISTTSQNLLSTQKESSNSSPSQLKPKKPLTPAQRSFLSNAVRSIPSSPALDFHPDVPSRSSESTKPASSPRLLYMPLNLPRS